MKQKLTKVPGKGSSIKYLRKISRKTNISNPLIRTRTCTYQGVINDNFSENFAYVLNGSPQNHQLQIQSKPALRRTLHQNKT